MKIGARILLIDDCEDIRTPLTAMLEMKGFNITEAQTGSEALAVLRSDKEISLILLDYILTDMSGLEFLEKKNEEGLNKNVPVVLISAISGLNTIAAPRDVVARVSKPFEFSKLIRTIELI